MVNTTIPEMEAKWMPSYTVIIIPLPKQMILQNVKIEHFVRPLQVTDTNTGISKKLIRP